MTTNTEDVQNVQENESEEEKKDRKFTPVAILPILIAVAMVGWYFFVPSTGLSSDDSSGYTSFVQEAQAATTHAEESLSEINEMFGVEDFSGLSVAERSELIANLSEEEQVQLSELIQDLQDSMSDAAYLTQAASNGVSPEGGASADALQTDEVQELIGLSTSLDELQVVADATLGAIEGAAEEGGALDTVADQALASASEEQALIDQLLGDLTQDLIASGLTEEEAAAIVEEVGGRMQNALEHASEQGLQGLQNAMEAQAKQSQSSNRKPKKSGGTPATGGTGSGSIPSSTGAPITGAIETPAQ